MSRKRFHIRLPITLASVFLAVVVFQSDGLFDNVKAQSLKGNQGYIIDPPAAPTEQITVKAIEYDTLTRSIVEERIRNGDPAFANAKIGLAGGLDFVASGVATRNSGSGVIRLRGVPSGATPVQAILYYGSISIASNPAVCFNGTSLLGVNFGTTAQPCWNSTGTFFAYIANVPVGALSPGINGDYRISCLPSSVIDGSAPGVTSLPLSEGVTLVVIYTHPSVPVSAQIFINHGPQFFAASTIDTVNFGVIGPHSILKHTRIGADGQVGNNNSSFLATTDERTFIGPGLPFTSPLVQIKGPGSGFNGDSDWNGGDGEPLNRLWDTHTDILPGNLIPAGNFFHTVRYVAPGDCIVWVAHILGAQ